MRSRYSAYVEHAVDYIINTCVHKGKEDIDRKSTQEWSEKSKWLGLKILSVEKGGPADTEGTVEFEATYEQGGLKDVHHETAKFKKEKIKKDTSGYESTACEGANIENENTENVWLYDEGTVIPKTVVSTTPKVGRNEPCPCGSGKKYKFCCGR